MEHIKFKTKCPFNIQPKTNGESLEEMLRRLTANKEPIPENVPPIFTPQEDGIIPDYDIRSDRFDVAMDAQDKFSRSKIAQGAEKPDITESEDKQEPKAED